MQAVARDIEKNCGQSVWDDGILRAGANRGELLGESFDDGDAQRPDVAGGRNDALGDLGRVVGTGMAEAGGEHALLRLSGRQVALFGVFIDGENTFTGKFELIVDGENIRGAHVSVNQALAVKKGEALQSGSENVAGFGGSERALRKKLRKIFLGVFHNDVEQLKVAETAAAGLESAEQVRMGKFIGVLPA